MEKSLFLLDWYSDSLEQTVCQDMTDVTLPTIPFIEYSKVLSDSIVDSGLEKVVCHTQPKMMMMLKRRQMKWFLMGLKR